MYKIYITKRLKKIYLYMYTHKHKDPSHAVRCYVVPARYEGGPTEIQTSD